MPYTVPTSASGLVGVAAADRLSGVCAGVLWLDEGSELMLSVLLCRVRRPLPLVAPRRALRGLERADRVAVGSGCCGMAGVLLAAYAVLGTMTESCGDAAAEAFPALDADADVSAAVGCCRSGWAPGLVVASGSDDGDGNGDDMDWDAGGVWTNLRLRCRFRRSLTASVSMARKRTGALVKHMHTKYKHK